MCYPVAAACSEAGLDCSIPISRSRVSVRLVMTPPRNHAAICGAEADPASTPSDAFAQVTKTKYSFAVITYGRNTAGRGCAEAGHRVKLIRN